jgi:long-subunit fatty acid transport protein
MTPVLARARALAVDLLPAFFLLSAFPALGAGLGVPDLGAQSLGQGSATVAAPDDLSAVYFNPASLAWTGGVRLQLEGRAVQHLVSFQRLDDKGANPDKFAAVSNAGAARLSPLVFVGMRLKLGQVPLAVALGGYPATGYSGYRFPDSSALKASLGTCPTCQTKVEEATAQRYSLISSDSSSYTVALALAAQVTPWLSVGAALQNTMVQVATRQAIAANPFAPGEFLGYDAVLAVNASDWFTPSGVVGASATLGDWRLGASFQLPADVHATGTLGVEVPTVLETLGATVTGNSTAVEMHLPWIARAGARWVRPAVEAELAFTYDAWSRYREVTFMPKDVAFEVRGSTVTLPDIHLIKGMKDSQSLRAGAVVRPGTLFSVSALDWLAVRFGALGETSAVPEERTSVDQAHWERLSVSAGLGARWDRFELTLSGAHFFQPDRQVRASAVTLPAPLRTEDAPRAIGNGDFSAQVDLAELAIAVHFDP